MVKHNNVVPNQHFHKKWAGGVTGTMRGPIQVKTWFNQPMQKKARRMIRAKKAASIAPRPMQKLRPAVHCPTVKYNMKTRLGRGFSLAELKAAGISKKAAASIGIAVDHRRINKSVESLQTNVARLKEYQSKLIIFPKKGMKKGDSSAEERATATQLAGTVLPIAAEAAALEVVAVTDDMKAFRGKQTLRLARTEKRMAGTRVRMAKEKEAAKNKKKK